MIASNGTYYITIMGHSIFFSTHLHAPYRRSDSDTLVFWLLAIFEDCIQGVLNFVTEAAFHRGCVDNSPGSRRIWGAKKVFS